MKSRRQLFLRWTLAIVIVYLFFHTGYAKSEIITDGTVGPAENLLGPSYQIGSEYGTRAGENLFHSFTRFDLNKGESATFAGPETVANVFNRVTGGFESRIDGIIRSEIPGANLYFLNPAGFIFGPNASLDVSGSFHVSTADYLAFPDGSQFSAIDPQGSSFSSAPPSAFGFVRDDPSPIIFQGSGSEYAMDNLGYDGIRVPEGETISLVGGDIMLTSGILDAEHRVETQIVAPGGTVNLVSSSSACDISMDDIDLQMDSSSEKGDITLNDGSLVDVTSDGSGNINVIGGNLLIDNANSSEFSTWGSSLIASARGNVNGGGIDAMIDHKFSLNSGATIYSNGLGNSHGRSISIEASEVEISDGSFLVSGADSDGSGANIDISADKSFKLIGNNSSILSASYGNAVGGDIAIDATNVEIKDGGYIASMAEDNGTGADIAIAADDYISLSGSNSFIWSSSIGNAMGGNISIDAGALQISDLANIESYISGDGKGGDVSITGDSAHIIDGAYVRTIGDGKTVGDIQIDVRYMELIAGDELVPDMTSRISSTNFSSGKSGSIMLMAEEYVLIDGKSSQPSFIATQSINGECGDIRIVTSDLTVRNSSNIGSNTWEGQAGTVEIYTDSLYVNGGILQTTVWGAYPDDLREVTTGNGFTISPPTEEPQSGSIIVDANDSIILEGKTDWNEYISRDNSFPIDVSIIQAITNTEGIKGGSITIKSDELYIDGGSHLGSVSGQTGVSGSIDIECSTLTIKDDAGITAGTFNDTDGGKIDIVANDTTEIEGFISTWSEGGGRGGQIQLKTPSLSIIDGGKIECRALSKGDGGDIVIDSKDINIYNKSSIDTSSTDVGGNAGNIYITTNNLSAEEYSLIRSDAIETDGGNIEIAVSDLLYLDESHIVTRVEGGEGTGGNIRIEDPRFLVLNDAFITANAYGGDGGNISIAADQLVYTPGSSGVSASSELGVDGQISINAFSKDIGRDVSALPAEPTDPADLMESPCAARTGEEASSLIVCNREGTPRPLDDWQPCPVPSFDAFHSLDGLNQSERRALLMAETLYRRGLFSDALSVWEENLHLAQKTRKAHSHTLMYMASARSEIGHYGRAGALLHQASSIIDKPYGTEIPVMLRLFLSDLYLALRDRDRSIENLAIAQEGGDFPESGYVHAASLNAEGNIEALRGNTDSAIKIYESALAYLGSGEDDALLRSAIQLNVIRARLASNISDGDELLAYMESVKRSIESIPISHGKAAYAAALGLLALDIRDRIGVQSDTFRELANQSFRLSEKIALKIGDEPTTSYAQGCLASLLVEEGQINEAMTLCKKAMLTAQHSNSPELLYQWQWLAGRIERRSGTPGRGISWYQRAVDTLSEIQGEFYTGYRGDRDVFSERIKPVYLEMADILISESEYTNVESERVNKLKQGLDVIEAMKTAEVRDYYEDDCVTQNLSDGGWMDRLPNGDAVLYPISFKDRLSLVLVLPDTITHIRVPVDALTLKQHAERFRSRLQNYEDIGRVQFYGKPLYEWLVQPIIPYLDDQHIETIIVAPDGPLRLIPFTALYDGRNYLVEKYAVVTIPGISISISPESAPPFDVLSGGLSMPKYGFAALPHVSDELATIEDLMGGVVLMDESYTRSRLDEELKATNYDILHLATHGIVDRDHRESFLLAYDGRITMDKLSRMVGVGRFRQEPLELLTLSACETAVGDERAALGLAGIALKAGARSSVATLWKINDEASSIFTRIFYESLIGEKISKSRALQRAQNRLLEHPRFYHPSFWSSFILIGDWA